MEAARVPVEESGERLRLVALLLMAWRDVPVRGSRVRGDSGSGIAPGDKAHTVIDPATGKKVQLVEGRNGKRRRDELLLRLERRDDEGSEPGSVVEIAAERADRRHPAFDELDAAMFRLRAVNGAAWRVLHRRLAGVVGGGALAEVHVLAEQRFGEFPLWTALVALSRLLPERMVFPREVVAAVAAWEQWLAAGRPRQGRKPGQTVAAELSPGALAGRRLYAQALAEAGVPQYVIGERLGVSQSAVSRMLRCSGMADVSEAFTFQNSPASGRAGSREALAAERLRTQPVLSGGASVEELQAKWRLADGARRRLGANLPVEECILREAAWAHVAKVRGW